MNSTPSTPSVRLILRSILLKSLALLMITSVIACRSMHQPNRVDKNGNGSKNDKPTGGSNKPISQKGLNASGYLFLSSSIARNSLRLITIAIEGADSEELLDCQKLTTKKSSATEIEYSIVSLKCSSELEGEELFTVKMDDKKDIISLVSENTRGLKLRKIKKSPSDSTDILSEILIAKTTLERTAIGVFKVSVDANMDYTILGKKASQSNIHEVDVTLSGVLNLTQKDKVLFDLTESIVEHKIKKNGKETTSVRTNINRSGDVTTDVSTAMTCSIPSSEYQLKQEIKLANESHSATVLLTASKGVILNDITKTKYKPTKICDQNYLQIADALRTVTIRERGFSALGKRSGNNKKATDSRDTPVKYEKSENKSETKNPKKKAKALKKS
jgi:hypothetical protein